MFNERYFKAEIVRNGLSMKEVARRLNIDESTLYRKIKNNGNFSREEINKLILLLHIEDPKSIFFSEKLA